MTDFSSVTETWGLPASAEQLMMQSFRYWKAAQAAAGGRVLEVGCGTGMGIPLLQRHSSSIVGGDYTLSLLTEARRHLPAAKLVRHDALALPFADRCFDAVLLLEMLYYVADIRTALREAHRVLRPGGRVMISVPNPDRPDFNPSPFSVSYPSQTDLRELLESAGFDGHIYGAFPITHGSSGLRETLRRFAVRNHLIPKSMRMKALVKWVIYGGRLPRLGEVHALDVGSNADWELVDAASPSRAVFKNYYALAVAQP